MSTKRDLALIVADDSLAYTVPFNEISSKELMLRTLSPVLLKVVFPVASNPIWLNDDSAISPSEWRNIFPVERSCPPNAFLRLSALSIASPPMVKSAVTWTFSIASLPVQTAPSPLT